MIIEHGEEVNLDPIHNHIYYNNPPVIKNSRINFKGNNNILFIEDDVRIYDSNISFCSDNAIVYLSKNTKHPYKIKVDAWRGTTVYYGHDNYFNGVFSAIVSERQNLIVGNEGVFSFGIWLRTADPHIIYDIDTSERVNLSKSILIGDHVWIGQNSLLLKGSIIGSGSIIAANSVIAGKTIDSNSIWGGNPAKMLRSHVFFSDSSVHNYTAEETEKSLRLIDDTYVYHTYNQVSKENNKALNQFFRRLSETNEAEKRLKVLEEFIKNNDKNRFAFSVESKSAKPSIMASVKSYMRSKA